MTALAKLLEQRSHGHVKLSLGERGVGVLSEAGSAKVRVPRGGHDAILINTSGGLAGGDTVSISLEAGKDARLSVTTQAAERVYRTLGPPAEIQVSLQAKDGATLFWLPQETIFYEGSALLRRIDVDLDASSTFVALEPMVFGRQEMGEVVTRITVNDRWHVRQNGKHIHFEAFKMRPDWPHSQAMFADNRAIATLLMLAPDAEQHLDFARAVIAERDGASAWNGKLVVRLLAKDGYELRKKLIPLMRVLIGVGQLPKCWTF
jgi:urease accessory protein